MAAGVAVADPASAQAGVARVNVAATLHVPALLRMDAGVVEVVREGDEVLTRVTVYVTANGAWQLTGVAHGAKRVRLESGAPGVLTDAGEPVARGRSGMRIPIILEYRLPVDAEPPQLEWILGAA